MSKNRMDNALVFYDLDVKNIDVEGFYAYILEWFKKYDQVPTRMALSGENVKPSTKTKTFKHYDKVLKENNYEKIEYIWLGSTPADAKYDTSDAIFSIELSLDSKPYVTIVFDDAVIPFSKDSMALLAKDLSSFFKSNYAIGFQRHNDKGPSCYAMGVIYNGGYSDIENAVIAKWLYGYPKEYNPGDLRDVYPLNFISQAHLERQVEGKSFKQWIELSPHHGTLESVTDTLWMWSLNEGDISSVREALKNADLLVVYR